MPDWLQRWDAALFAAINQGWASPLADYFFAIISSQRFWTPLIILGALMLAWRGGFRGRVFLITAALAVGIGDGIVNQSIRAIVQKPRPHEVEIGARRVELRNEYPPRVRVRIRKNVEPHPGGSSFPSGHVINNTAVAALAAALWPRLIAPLAAWVILMGLARVYTGSHYPLDVLGTIPLALAVAWLSYQLTALSCRLLGSKFPRLLSAWQSLQSPHAPPPHTPASSDQKHQPQQHTKHH